MNLYPVLVGTCQLSVPSAKWGEEARGDLGGKKEEE
jgi:hypothetical protein